MAQWLRLQASNAGGLGLIPGQGTKILHAVRFDKNRKSDIYITNLHITAFIMTRDSPRQS